jgi:hypothetical protein
MDCVNLMTAAEVKLHRNDLPFIEKTETALSFLRSTGVLPIKRASINGHLHTSYSAMLVEALEQDVSVDIHTRRQADLHDRGVTTRIVKWLDDTVAQGVLIPANGSNIAKGALNIGELFKKAIQ